MGQELSSTTHFDMKENTIANSNTILSDDFKDDINFFYPQKFSSDLLELNNDQPVSNLQIKYIKEIQNHLFLLTKPISSNEINTEIHEKFIVNIANFIGNQSTKLSEELNNLSTYREQLKTSLKIKLKNDNNINLSIFSQTLIDSSSENDQQKTDQLSYFAIQSLISILLILIKSAEKNDPTIINEILLLTNQLCEQLPMTCLSSTNNLLFKSLEPLIIYLSELSLSTNSIISNQTIKILLSFSIAKGSFENILSLLNKLIFNTTEIFHVKNLIIQMNNYLTNIINQYENDEHEITELFSLNYLKSLNIYPTIELNKVNSELFTGQFISSIILSYIDIENEIIKQSNLSSISCEFHPITFKSLFNIIEQLSSSSSSLLNNIANHILIICLRLFTTHLQILHDVQSDINLIDYATNDELKIWLELLLKLSCNESSPQIAKEASKALINILNIQSSSSSITKKLILIQQYILENKHSILIEQFLIELNKTETLLKLIDSLHNENDKLITLPILYSFIDIYFYMNIEYKSQLETMLLSFQYLILSLLINNTDNKKFPIKQYNISSFIIEYLSYIFKSCMKEKSITNEVFNSILLGLCFLTESEIFIYEDIESIFLSILPLLTEYHLQNLNNDSNRFINCLIGRICHLLIIGLPQDNLEIEHVNKFKLPIFTGGYICDKYNDLFNSNLAIYSQCQFSNDIYDEKDFLMSIYNNTDNGAQLILKLKSFSKNKQRVLLKSIEQQANNACAAIFAVYIKYYRRINLAKSELLKANENKPSNHLLSLYEYANRIETLFATIKGQGGDCDEFYKHIRTRALFLLLSIKENYLIPLIKEDDQSSLKIIEYEPKKDFNIRRQRSQWTKAKHILLLLKNLFKACIRFKKLMLERKQKYDYESIFNRALDHFIYEDFYQSSILIINDEKQNEIDQIEKCLQRQHKRAIIRLITYRFIQKFIQNLINNNQNLEILSIYLPYLRKNDSDWSYFDHIQTTDYQLRKEISNTYYSTIKLILPLSYQSNNLAKNLFYLLSLSYESNDYYYEIIEPLFSSFVSYKKSSELNLQFISFNWFRLYVFQFLSEINTSNQILQQQQFIFNTLIFNEINLLKNNLSILPQEKKSNSLKDISLNWFFQANEFLLPNELYINQYLAFLLRSIRFYKNIISICATVNYLELLIDIYYHNHSNITCLLVIKLLRYLIPFISDNIDEIVRKILEKFFSTILYTIGENNTSKEIQEELINMYRIIISIDTPWKNLAMDFIFNSIQSNLNLQTIEINDKNQINQLRASLSILGGYIQSYRLGSLVKIDINDESTLALIIEINEIENLYTIQYFETNQIESVNIDKLRHAIDILPPNCNGLILDILGHFIQIDTIKNDSFILLELKRRSLSVLYYLLNNKKSIEIFMEKSYASILAKLCLSEHTYQQLKDLRIFNKQHLEQYSLSLDQCQIVEDKNDISNNSSISKFDSMNSNPLILEALKIPINGWKSYASQTEIDFLKKGRIGIEDISIVPMPRNIVDTQIVEECGIKHRFRGRIAPNYETTRVSFPTFIFDNIQLTEGKWYYCVRLPVAGVFQIGWATNGFSPSGGSGVGDDKYSWSYDGSRGVFFWQEGYYGQFDDLRWKENDVCGCGIEINGIHTNIKYWLNGKLLGTAFSHNINIPLSTTKCDLLPNGLSTTYYPAITLQWAGDPIKYCELIISPEDMKDCPLPNGYKPLLLPKFIQTENSIVNYPFHAYLINNNDNNQQQDFCLRKQINSSNNILRDFIHEYHIQTNFNIEDNYLNIPDKSDGLLLSFDNNKISSLTISFDYQILSTEDLLKFSLIKLNSTEISWTKTTAEKQKCVIIFLLKEQQIKIYTNNKQSEIFNYSESITNLMIHILPGISSRIQNLAIWKYILSDEQIFRLFTYDLFYIANDDQQMKEYRKQINTISFTKNQQEFLNELLIPFNEAFTEIIWEKKKKEIDENEFKYFKSHIDYSTIELFGNQTYLILNKSNDDWLNYTLVLDILIPNLPKLNEILTLISWNSKIEIYINHNGKICFDTHESSSIINLNEYFRLFILLHEQSFQIYLNNKLEIDFSIIDDQFQIKSNRIYLFKENNLTKNTTDEHTCRISFKSITYLNRSISIDEQLQLPKIIQPTLEMIAPNLIAMGYKKDWIQSLIEQNQIWNDIPTILWEQKEDFIKIDLENERKHYKKMISQLHPLIKSEILEELIQSSKFDTYEQIMEFSQRISTYLMSLETSNFSLDKSQLDTDWFSQTIQDLNITEWIRDETLKNEDNDNIYQLLDFTQTKTKKPKQSIEYSHKNLTEKQFRESRIACENDLIMIYARSTILNMLQIWSNDDNSTIFPIKKFGDYSVLKLLNHSEFDKDEKIDRIYLTIKSILEIEIKDDLIDKSSLFNYLKKELIIQSIQFLIKPSLIKQNIDKEIINNEQHQQQPNFDFILKILKLFVDLLSNKILLKQQQQIDLIIPILFPTSLINLIFNLFLLIPIHQSKIFILHLFTTLSRISNNFLLNQHMQQFFFQLLIELSSNTISINNYQRKKLEIALTDLIFILLTKSNNIVEEYRLKLPENIQNLFTIIDVIDVWTDSTKQKLLPKKFLEEFEDYHFNQDDFKKSNIQFNSIADQELTELMNNNLTLDNSFSTFIQSLPTESEPNPIFYKNYITLSNIAANSIQIRAKFIYLFNQFIGINLSIIDFSLPPGESFLTDQIRTIKFYLLSSIKFKLFNESLEKTETSYTSEWHIVSFDTVKASTDIENSENTMFYQAYQQLQANAHNIFRQSNEQLWHAQYIGMHSTDQGGPYRDSITRICSDICSTRLSLFILCPNGRTNVGLNRDCWIPNVYPPNKSISNKIQKQYRFIGQLLGMAIRKKHYLDIKFPSLFWKKLSQEEIIIEDIEAIDIQSFTIIDEMEKNIEQIKSIDVDHDIESFFSSIMSELRFDVVSSSGETYELIPGGKDIQITATNFKNYCSCYREYRLNEFNRQIDLIRQGLYTIIPSYYFSLFTANELEESVCGKGEIDIELLKRNTTYGGDYNQNSSVVERFWKVLGEMFTNEEKKLFLIFVWGRSTLPSRDEDFHSKFTISSYDVYGNNVDQTLPRSHTCFFTIDLPAYSTKEITYERLNYAITCCSSIDGDGNMNDTPNIDLFDTDENLDEL